MSNQLMYVFSAYLFTFIILLLLGLKSFFSYLSVRKKLSKMEKNINKRL